MQLTTDLLEDNGLFELMIDNYKDVPAAFQAGVYWKDKIRRSQDEIRRCGIGDFRGYYSRVAESYADGPGLDARKTLYGGWKRNLYRRVLERVFPFNRTWARQVEMMKQIWLWYLASEQQRLENLPRVIDLMEKWCVNDTLRGGCVSKVKLRGKEVSIHYLQTLDTLDNLLSSSLFAKGVPPTRFLELGGGFGVNVHLILQNLPSIRKVLYVDLPPNLYVGTQYLRSLYPENVSDYRSAQSSCRVVFAPDNQLEIVCITPHQLPKVESEFDWFHNAHSFVEMPRQSVETYAQLVSDLLLPRGSIVTIVSYGGFDLNTTFHPEELPAFWSRYGFNFETEAVETLRAGTVNLQFIGTR